MDRSDKLRRRRIALGLGSFAMALLLAWWLAGAGSPQADDRFSTELVRLDIGPSRYAIPRNYIDFVRRDRDGRPTWVQLRALWPGLEPLTPENAHLWERRIPERQIRIAILPEPRVDGYQRLQNVRKWLGDDYRPQPAGDDLIFFGRGTTRLFLSTVNTVATPNGRPMVLVCNDVPEKTYRSFDVKLVCKVYYNFPSGEGLYYRFFEKNISQWKKIDRSVRQLVNSFHDERS
jgi:hypothetical protein